MSDTFETAIAKLPKNYIDAEMPCPKCFEEGTVYGDWEEDVEMEAEGPVKTFHGTFICISCKHTWTE